MFRKSLLRCLLLEGSSLVNQPTLASMFRRRCAPFVIVSLALLVHAQSRSSSTPSMKGTVVTRPEQMTGLWESDGAVGINLRLITTIKGQPKTFAGWSQYWDSLQIGVYQRHGSEQNVGDANWIMDNLGGVNFDGTRLVAKMPDLSIDVDLSYDIQNQTWNGWFHRRTFARRVVLSRPRAKPGITKSRLVGTWRLGESARECLHVAQQSDGGLAGWYDTLSLPGSYRYAPGIVPLPWTSEYSGELATVSEPGYEVLRVGASPYTAAAGPPAFVVKLSKEGDRLMGGREGGNASLSFQWRKVDGDSCVQQMR